MLFLLQIVLCSHTNLGMFLYAANFIYTLKYAEMKEPRFHQLLMNSFFKNWEGNP